LTYQQPPGGQYPQQPGGYRQPLPPQGNYPPGPWYPQAPPPRKSRRVALTIVAAVVLVAAGGGVWYFTMGGGGGSPAEPSAAARDYTKAVETVGAAEVAWEVDQGDAESASAAEDHWVVGGNLVRRLPGRVVSYDLKTGKVAWETKVGAVGDGRCGSSQQHSKNRVALLVGSGGDGACEKLTVLDLATGKALVNTDLPPIEGTTATATVPVVFGEKVIVPGAGGARVLDINTGAALSMPAKGAECESRDATLRGELLLVNARCQGKTGPEYYKFRAFDANLKMVWDWVPPKGADGKPAAVLGVLSAEPLVVELGFFGHPTQLVRVDPAANKVVPIQEYDNKKYVSACAGWSLDHCQSAKVVDGKVILSTRKVQVNPDSEDAAPGQQSTEFRNELVAFDVETGEEAWRTGMVAGRLLTLVPTADEDGVVAFQPKNPNDAMAIAFSVDPATGDLTPVLPIGPTAHGNDRLIGHLIAAGFDGTENGAVWHDGVFVIFKTTHRPATKGDPDTVAFTMTG
jgi:outer membrane protein assembly factor BamB